MVGKGFKKTGGRNNQGRITVRHRGGGHKRKYKFVSFNFNTGPINLIKTFVYDSFRSVSLASIQNNQGDKKYYLMSSIFEKVRLGSFNPSLFRKPLKAFFLGEAIHGLSKNSRGKALFVKAAGCYCQVLYVLQKHVVVKIPSGSLKSFSKLCEATEGTLSNESFQFKKMYKAGQNRWKGFRPTVRGVAINPVDHPHGGGEGKSSGGRPSVSPWGLLAKCKSRKR